MSRSASVYGMSTWHVPAVLRVGEPLQHRERAGRVRRQLVGRAARRACPRRRRAAPPMSMPISAAGSSPTGVSTLKRPPTLGGMSSAVMPSARAIGRSAPFSGSVTKHEVLARAASPSAPSSRLAHDEVLRHRLRGAARLRRHDEQRAPRGRGGRAAPRSSAGSTLSSTCSRGMPPRARRRAAFHCGGRSAVRSAIGPSAEPPMPSTTTSCDAALGRARATKSSVCTLQRAIVGQVEEAERHRTRARSTPRHAPRRSARPRRATRRPDAAAIGGDIMFV